MGDLPELLHEVLFRLRKEQRGWSRPTLSRETVRYRHVPEGTIQKYENEKNAGIVPPADILESLAAALDVPPETFYEYPIAVAARRKAMREQAEELERLARRRRRRPGKDAA